MLPVSADTDVAAAAAAEFTIEAAAAAAPPAEGPAAAAPPVAAADTAAVAPSSRRTGESGGGGRTIVVGVPAADNAPALAGATTDVDFSRGRPWMSSSVHRVEDFVTGVERSSFINASVAPAGACDLARFVTRRTGDWRAVPPCC